MKKKITRIVGVAVSLVLVCSLAIALAPAAPVNEVSADPGSGIWTKFPTPRSGALSDYLMTSTSNTQAGPGPVAQAIDGTLYVYWDVGEVDDLYKSTDNGRTWGRCSSSTDELPSMTIVDIACSLHDANIVYVTSTTAVYRSNDAGATFAAIAAIPASTYDNTDELITSLDVGYDGTSHWIVVGTARPAPGCDGEVYIKQDPYLGPWQEQDITDNKRVLDVACAPDFATANPLVVAVTDNGSTGYIGPNQQTFVEYQWSGGAWSKVYLIQPEVSASVFSPTGGNVTSADIVFPGDFESPWPNPNVFIGISSANIFAGDVYNAVGSNVIDCQADGVYSATNVNSLAIAGTVGDSMLLAGTTDEPNIYHSEDDGGTWADSKYDPSGTGLNAYVAVQDDYYDSGIGWAFVAGVEGAMSQTPNFGISWYQISLINTDIDAIRTLSYSPAYAEDSTLFMVTDNLTGASAANLGATAISSSVWRWDGSYWNRVCDNITQDIDTLDGVKVSPEFDTDTAVFIADKTKPKLWRSIDSGYRFKKQSGAPPAFAGGWIVIDSSTIVIGDQNATSNQIRISKNNGTTWSGKTATGCTLPTTFARSPNYEEDTTLLMGDLNDAVFRSEDGGSVWRQIPSGVDVESGAGTCYVAFDTDYANNNTVFSAAGGTSDVYRLVIDSDTTWNTIDALGAVTWPGSNSSSATAGNVSGLLTGEGTVYVTDNNTNAVIRCVNPLLNRTSGRGPFFEPMNSAWTPIATSNGLWITKGDSNVLWTIRGTDAIWSYEDKLTMATELTEPKEGFSTGRSSTATLSWEALDTAKQYFVWVSTNKDFSVSSIPTTETGQPFNAGSSTTSFRVTGLTAGKTYYWKVSSADSLNGRAATFRGRTLGPWSETRSFSTGIAGGEWNPFRTAEGYVGNVAPPPGASDVPLKAAFQWNAADWADGYEFVLADNAAYSNPIVSLSGAKALEVTAYVLDKNLAHGTSYFWKVRAISATTNSPWGEGIFTTIGKPPAKPKPAPPPPPPVTIPPAPAPIGPAYIWAIIGIGAILVIAVIVLIVRTRRVV